MNRKNQKRKRKNKFILVLFFLAILVIICVCLVKFLDSKNNKDKDTDLPIKNSSTETLTEQSTNQQDQSNENADNERKIPQYEGDSPNYSETLTGVITYSEVSDDNLVIRVNIDQYLLEGSCKLSIIQNNIEQFNISVNIIDMASSSTCEGFDVPVSALVSGKAIINIQFNSDDKVGSISKEIDI